MAESKVRNAEGKSSPKYIFVTGGVVSSLGKGIIAASLARLLLSRGFKVAIQKFDPYINIDPGTLNPYEHGECYVTVDGKETDLDLGHYERFTDIQTTEANNVTTGRVYKSVIEKERRGEFLGKTVQIIPHITDELKFFMTKLGDTGEYDFIITEIGGTVGDIESTPFLETVRQLRWEMGRNAISIHLTYVPYLAAAKELKTKPTQHSVKQLQQLGIQPDILVLRAERDIPEGMRRKVAQFCNVKPEAVVQSVDVSSIYEVPMMMHSQHLDDIVLDLLGITSGNPIDLSGWENFLSAMKTAQKNVRIGLVGKYVELPDAYKSIQESLIQAATWLGYKLDLDFIHSEKINHDNVGDMLRGHDGIIIAPGFGARGIEGKIEAVRWCRENDIPTFGICLGMQCLVIEFARNVLGYEDANSAEIAAGCSHNVIDLMQNQKNIKDMGGTMRLGAYPCRLRPDSTAANAYGKDLVYERHRHRYEFNEQYREEFESAGMKCVGENPDSGLVEIVELPENRWFVGTQFHPEYQSTVLHPHPLFLSFVKAAVIP